MRFRKIASAVAGAAALALVVSGCGNSGSATATSAGAAVSSAASSAASAAGSATSAAGTAAAGESQVLTNAEAGKVIIGVKFSQPGLSVKNPDGTFSGFDARNLSDKGVGDFAVFEGASSGLLGDEDAAHAADAIEPGSAAVMIMYENRWAAPFVAAVRRNGGVPVAFERIRLEDLIEALDAAEAAS